MSRALTLVAFLAWNLGCTPKEDGGDGSDTNAGSGSGTSTDGGSDTMESSGGFTTMPTTMTPETGGMTCDLQVAINANHGHYLDPPIVIEDVGIGATKEYLVSGEVGHEHSLTVTEADWQKLKDDGSVSVNTTTAADHSHLITIEC